MVGFTAIADYCRINQSSWDKVAPEIGNLIQRAFIDDTVEGNEMRLFKGLVIAEDPTDPMQQYQILYEDGDGEWLSFDALRKLKKASSK